MYIEITCPQCVLHNKDKQASFGPQKVAQSAGITSHETGVTSSNPLSPTLVWTCQKKKKKHHLITRAKGKPERKNEQINKINKLDKK
jgi:hypothetical protein